MSARTDAELHRLCGEWWRLDNLSEDEWERDGADMFPVMRRIAETPAHTSEGMRARARVIRAYGAIDDGGSGNELLRSLIRDVLREQPASREAR